MTRAAPAICVLAPALAPALAAVLAAACGGSAAKPPPAGAGGPSARTAGAPVAEGDDEVEDGVTFESSRGRMDPAVIEAGLEPHKAALGDCYMERVGQRRWLGGRVTIHWDIQRDGAVSAVKLSESTLGAREIERCLLEVARAATFGKPVGGDADFSLPLDFSPTGRVSLWDEDQALKAVGGQTIAFDACAKAKGVKGPMPEDVTVTLYLGPQGKAQSVGFSSPASVLEDAWVDCAEKAALAWRLPDPKGGVAKLAVKYRPAEP